MSMASVASLACRVEACARSFGSEAARASHESHEHAIGASDPLSYPCRVSTCQATFGTPANRDEHMRDAHKSPPEKTIAPPQRKEATPPMQMPIASDPKPFKCPELGCAKAFMRPQALGSHRFRAHGTRSTTRTPPRTGAEVKEAARRAPEPSEQEVTLKGSRRAAQAPS